MKKEIKSTNVNPVKKPAFEPPKMKKAGSAYKPRGYGDKPTPPVMKSAMPADLKFKSKLQPSGSQIVSQSTSDILK